jgi:hypothetical protein
VVSPLVSRCEDRFDRSVAPGTPFNEETSSDRNEEQVRLCGNKKRREKN